MSKETLACRVVTLAVCPLSFCLSGEPHAWPMACLLCGFWGQADRRKSRSPPKPGDLRLVLPCPAVAGGDRGLGHLTLR